MFWFEFRFYDSVGFLNDLIDCVGRTCAGLVDKRQGRNTQFSMRDIGLAGFSPFLMQCPSFLSHQRQVCEGIGHGRSNCQTLLGMERIPTDNHIRAMLDDVFYWIAIVTVFETTPRIGFAGEARSAWLGERSLRRCRPSVPAYPTSSIQSLASSI